MMIMVTLFKMALGIHMMFYVCEETKPFFKNQAELHNNLTMPSWYEVAQFCDDCLCEDQYEWQTGGGHQVMQFTFSLAAIT